MLYHFNDLWPHETRDESGSTATVEIDPERYGPENAGDTVSTIDDLVREAFHADCTEWYAT